MDGLGGSSSSGAISATSIGLIVGLGIVPVIILIWVVSWLFWCYPYDRSCCCTRRKKKQADEEINGHRHRTGRSLDSFHEKTAYPMPGPERPSGNYRTESGNSTTSNNGNAYAGNGTYGNSRLMKSDPRSSVNSTNTMQYTQEPKPFV